MRVGIRQDIFETNSSSAHSLCITKNDEKIRYSDDIWINPSGKWVLYSDELIFDRYPFMVLSDFSEKVKYAIATFCGTSKPKDEAQKNLSLIRDVCREMIPYFDDFFFETIDGDDSDWKYGYAENYGKLEDWMKQNNVSIRDFLLSKRYIIVCDGDEYGVWDKMKSNGLVNVDIIQKEVEF